MDHSTQYLGLKLKSPIVVSATPLSQPPGNARRMEDAGAGAIVLHSLFEEQLILESKALDEDLSRGTESFAEALDYLPELSDYRMTQDVYLEHLRAVKAAVSIPVIGSLNGATVGGWVRFAREMEQAGADAIELNTFALSTDVRIDAEQIEDQLIELVRAVSSNIHIPVSVKLSPFYTSLPYVAARLTQAGAQGLVLFNRFYQPEFDIETLEARPSLHFSMPGELLLRLHWTAILYGHIHADLAVTGGVYSAEDVIKCIMVGGNVAMMASALHVHGIEHIGRVLANLDRWVFEHGYESVDQMRGSLSRRSAPDTSPYDRGNYIKTLSSYTLRDTISAF